MAGFGDEDQILDPEAAEPTTIEAGLHGHHHSRQQLDVARLVVERQFVNVQADTVTCAVDVVVESPGVIEHATAHRVDLARRPAGPHGVDAVLLIARVLTDGRLSEWVQLCAELQLTALVEVHDEDELQAALDARATVIGINSRDLRTFKTDLAGAIKLRALIPDATLAVAESGIHTPDDIQAITNAGFDAGLIGEALMTASDPGAALRALTGHPS